MITTTLLTTSLLAAANPTSAEPGPDPLALAPQAAPGAALATSALTGVDRPSLFGPPPQDAADFGGESTHSDWYVQIGVQGVTTRNSDGPDEEIDFNEGFAVPLLLGRRFSSETNENLGFAVELEGIYADQEADDSSNGVDVTNVNVMVNGVVDYSLNEKVGIYGGAGVGLGWLDLGNQSDNLSNFEDEDGPFLSWQVKAGVLFQASETIGIDLGYRFLNTDDAELDDTNGNAQFDLETRQHMIGLGVRFDV